MDRQGVWESRDEPQGAASSTRAWVSRSPSVPRATGAPGLGLHGLCNSGALAGMTGLSTQDSEGPELARAGVQSRQSVASSAPPGRGGTRPPKPERQRTVSLGGSSPPGQQAGQRNFLKWLVENRLARGRLRRSPPDTPCAVPPGPPGLPSASPLSPRPHPSGALAGGHSPHSTRGPRSPRARVRHVPATQLRERGSAPGVQSQVT